jgi:hypothetical protein
VTAGLPALTALEARAVEVTGRYALDVITTRTALDALPSGSFDSPERKAHSEACERWVTRPRGRSAPPGDLSALQQTPGEHPHGGDRKCRRCHGACSMEGHPYGCPRTPTGLFSTQREPIHSCYCGQVMIAAPGVFGPCCENTPPVRIPGGCRWCGSDLCAVGDPDDLPEEERYYTEARYPDMGSAWVHPRCIDEYEIERAAPGRQAQAAADVARRRARRRLPIGVVGE